MVEEERDVYDTILTQAELQKGVMDVNTVVAKEEEASKCKTEC